MIVDFKFGHKFGQECSDEEFEKLRKLIPSIGDQRKEEIWFKDFTANLAAVKAIYHGEVTINQVIEGDTTPSIMNRLLTKMESLENPDLFNERCQVIVPGLGLLNMNEVELAEDCNTDDLNSRLDAGWRIIAVCPPDQRRPDYILGRSKD